MKKLGLIIILWLSFTSLCFSKDYPKTIYTEVTNDITRELHLLKNNQKDNSGGSLSLGGYKLGISVDDLTRLLYTNSISDSFLPNRWTLSSLSLGGERVKALAKYGFESNSRLVSIELAFKETRIEQILPKIEKTLGDNYLIISRVNSSNQDQRYVWYINDVEYHLYHESGYDGGFRMNIADPSSGRSGASLEVSIVDFLKQQYGVIKGAGGNEMSISYYSSPSQSTPVIIKYDGKSFYLAPAGGKFDQITEGEAYENFHSDKTLKPKGRISILESPNGKPRWNPDAGHSFSMSSLDNVYALQIQGNWVKVRHVQYPKNYGWVQISELEGTPTYVVSSSRVGEHIATSVNSVASVRRTRDGNSSGIIISLVLFAIMIAIYASQKYSSTLAEYNGSNYDDILSQVESKKKIRGILCIVAVVAFSIPLIDYIIHISQVGNEALYYTKSPIFGSLYGQDNGAVPGLYIAGIAIVTFLSLLATTFIPSNKCKEIVDNYVAEQNALFEKRDEELRLKEEKRLADEKAREEYQNNLFNTYGTPERVIYLNADDLPSSVIAFSTSSKLFVQGRVIDYASIISCSWKDDSHSEIKQTSYSHSSTKADTGSMIGRAIVGDLIAGGAGAIIGGTTGKKQTDTTTTTTGVTTTFHHFYVIINVEDVSAPVIRIDCGKDEDITHEISGMINAIIRRENRN